MEEINYKGVAYPTREIYLKDADMDITVSTESLSGAICPDDEWDKIGDEEKHIDEKIYFYAPDDLVLTASDEDLTKFVEENS